MKKQRVCACGQPMFSNGRCKRHWSRWYRARHKTRIRAQARTRYAENPQRSIQREKDYQARVRQAVLDAYGNSCACCGETEQEFLQLDHIHGGGRAHLRELIRNGKGGAGVTLYRAV